MTIKQIVLAFRPKGILTADNFRFENIELPEIREDEVLLKGMYYSVDNFMRGRMSDAKSYAAPFEIEKTIAGGVVAKVMASKSDNFRPGEIVLGNLPWQEQIITSEKMI